MTDIGKQRGSATPLSRSINALLHAKARELGVENKTLARSAGMSEATISRVFRADRVLDVNELSALCEALGLVPWQALKTAEQSLSVAPVIVEPVPPSELDLAANTDEEEPPYEHP